MMLYKRVFTSVLTTLALMSSSSAFFTTTPPTAAHTTSFVRHAVSFLRMSGASEFASKDEVSRALQDEKATILDVRRPDEIAETGHWNASRKCGWAHMPCMPNDAALLKKTAESLLRDKSAPVVIHCASGKRAAKAKEVLDSLGYENVLNAGGWKEVQGLMEQED